MLAGSSCLLGSINLSEFVKNEFSIEKAKINYDELAKTVIIAVKALNEVLIEGMDLHPLKIQRDSVHDYRAIGLGFFGVGDMLIKLGLKYGSKESLETLEKIFKFIARIAVKTSLILAKEHGYFPKCKPDLLIKSEFIKNLDLDEGTINEIKKYGLFNSQLLTCAPTGSISTLLQVSSGVEPNFAFSYNRRTVSLNSEETTYKVDANIVEKYKKMNNVSSLPDFFVTANDINPEDRIKVQSVLQRYIDASISSTINLPENTTIEEIERIYTMAWYYKLKGITIWRNNCQRQAILSVDNTKKEDNKESDGRCLDCISTIRRNDLGQVLSGETYKHQTACGTLYITVNKDNNGNIVEIFTNSSKNGTCKANLNGETRLASLALRAGVKTEEVIDTLKGIQCQSCAFSKAKGNKIDGISCPDIISKCLKKSYGETEQKTKNSSMNTCPECGKELLHIGGCLQCECGYSKCN